MRKRWALYSLETGGLITVWSAYTDNTSEEEVYEDATLEGFENFYVAEERGF